jgi:hypothetical protein
MPKLKLLPLALIALLVASLFFTWVTIESKQIVVSGFQTAGTSFGKPGWFHVVLCAVVGGLLLVPKVWGTRAGFFISTLNVAWAVRNYFIISACYAGVCPVKHTALYVLLISSFLISISLLFIPGEKS